MLSLMGAGWRRKTGSSAVTGSPACYHGNPFILQTPGHRSYPHFRGTTPPPPRLLSVLLLSTRPRVKHLQWRWLQGHLGHPARHRCGREVLIQRRGRNSGFLVRSVDTQGLRDAKAFGTFLSSKT